VLLGRKIVKGHRCTTQQGTWLHQTFRLALVLLMNFMVILALISSVHIHPAGPQTAQVPHGIKDIHLREVSMTTPRSQGHLRCVLRSFRRPLSICKTSLSFLHQSRVSTDSVRNKCRVIKHTEEQGDPPQISACPFTALQHLEELSRNIPGGQRHAKEQQGAGSGTCPSRAAQGLP